MKGQLADQRTLPKLISYFSTDTDNGKHSLGSFRTMRKLQNILVIPRDIELRELQKQEIQLPGSVPNTKYLLVSDNNVIYYGCLSNAGIPEDKRAICIFAQGSFYEGEFKAGKMEGKGNITDLIGSYKYEGEWKNGLPHGQGNEKIQDNYYSGYFSQGRKHGKGIQTFSDGSKFIGSFSNNVIQGQGKYITQNNQWSGTWKDGYLEGMGEQVHVMMRQNIRRQSIYRGQFHRGEKHGKGLHIWPQSHFYEGEFNKGQLDGSGIFQFKGKKYTGKWSNGTQVRIAQVHSSISPSSSFQKPSSQINKL